MIKNFDEVRQQLEALASIVNEFKSEAVQLRVVEALLLGVVRDSGGKTHEDEPPPADPPATTQKKAKKGKAKKGQSGKAAPATKAASKKGPKAAVQSLLQQGYFAQRRTIGVIEAHLKDKKALAFSSGALQTALNRMVQNDELQRESNADKQIEYYK